MKLLALGSVPQKILVGTGSGTQRGRKVMVGTGSGAVLAWQTLQAVASGAGRYTVPQNTWFTLLQAVVVGNGPGTFQGVYSWGIDALQFLAFTRSVRLLVNGEQVAYETGTFSNKGWNVTLSSGERAFYEGDIISVQAYTTGTNRTSARNVDSSNLVLTAQ